MNIQEDGVVLLLDTVERLEKVGTLASFNANLLRSSFQFQFRYSYCSIFLPAFLVLVLDLIRDSRANTKLLNAVVSFPDEDCFELRKSTSVYHFCCDLRLIFRSSSVCVPFRSYVDCPI